MIDNIKLGKALNAVDKMLSSEEMKAVTKLVLMEHSDYLSPKGQSMAGFGIAVLVKDGIELPFIRQSNANHEAKKEVKE